MFTMLLLQQAVAVNFECIKDIASAIFEPRLLGDDANCNR